MDKKNTNLKVVERISSAVKIDSATLISHIDRTGVKQALSSYVNHLNGINSLPEDEVNSLRLELASELSEIALELEFGISSDEMYNEEGNYHEKFQDRFNDLFGIIEDELTALDKNKKEPLYLMVVLMVFQGGREYSIPCVITSDAKDPAAAAEEFAKTYWGECDYVDEDGYYCFSGGEISVRVDKTTVISKEQHDWLQSIIY